jgi:hypothetical protein
MIAQVNAGTRSKARDVRMMPCRHITKMLSALLLSLVVLFPGPLSASEQDAASAWVAHDDSRLRLVAAGERVGDGGGLRLGLHFQLEPGWKIYSFKMMGICLQKFDLINFFLGEFCKYASK